MSLRDSTIVVLETSRAYIRAGQGLYELLRLPTVEVQARAGLRRTEPVAASSRAPSSTPRSGNASEYIVGKQLDDLLAAGEDLDIVWPFANGGVSDWAAAEALWKHVLFTQLSLRRSQNESPVMHAISPTFSRDIHERTCKIFFERFNVPAYSVVERPLCQVYAANALAGLIVDVNTFKTDVTPVVDSIVMHAAHVVLPVGSSDCEKYLAHLWRTGASPGVLSALEGEPDLDNALVELAALVYREGLVKVPSDGETVEPEDEGVTNIAAVLIAGKEKAVIEAGTKKKRGANATAAEREREREIAALDLVTVTFREKEITVGKERHRMCEPLFDLSLLRDVPGIEPKEVEYEDVKESYMNLSEGVFLSVSRLDLHLRPIVLDGLFVCGNMADAKGLGIALQSRLAYHLTQRTDGEVQPSASRLLRVPEYFGEYREKGDRLSSFLGASIVAKLVFQDVNGRSFVQKADYGARGPRAIIELCPTVL
ncbi:actin-related protein [Exidia glandulosa HHB12029]|uniref:Actin-related protein n=1 Tax=Exidia glandulosa HHB12029 TaxID=1314781 RepID=A0A165KIH0_EXIGL|nr:actin-related protein [Exidia glandulosa HHB12029]